MFTRSSKDPRANPVTPAAVYAAVIIAALIIIAAAALSAAPPASAASLPAGMTKAQAAEDPLNGTGAYADSSAKAGSLMKSLSLSAPTTPARFSGYSAYYGPDISVWDSTSKDSALTQTQWDNIAGTGYKFAIIRIGYSGTSTGKKCTDPGYALNIQRAHAAGLKVGVYYFSQALSTSEAASEASYAVNLITPYSSYIDLPVVMDYEFAYGGRLTASKPAKSVKTSAVLTFFSTVRSAGFSPMLYANKSFLEDDVTASAISGSGAVWLANWTSATSYSGDYAFWQWTDSGVISGITPKVDLNAWYTNDPDEYLPYYTGSAPSGLTQSKRTLTGSTMKWNTLAKAVSYDVYRASTYTGTFSKIASVTSNSYKDTGLVSGREYYYKLTASGADKSGNIITSKLTSGYVRGYTTPAYTRTAKVKRSAYLLKRPGTTKVVKTYKGASMNVLCWTRDKNNAVWYRVKYKKNSKTYYGYIKKTYVYITKTGTTKSKQTIRSGPGTSYKAVVSIAKGRTVTIKSTSRRDSAGTVWYKVKYMKYGKAYYGYINSKYIK